MQQILAFFCFGWGFLGAFICRVLGVLEMVDRIIEYPELKGIHKDYQVQLSAPAQHHPQKSHHSWEHCPNASQTLSGLVL